MKKGEWDFNGKTKKPFIVKCLEKPFDTGRSWPYQKGNPIVCHIVYETDKTPY